MSIRFHISSSINRLGKAFAIYTLMTFASASSAASVEQLTFAELCDQAVLIFEGRVIASETRADDSHFGFGTYVTFEVLDRIKGPKIEPEIELRFAGGQMGENRLSIADMEYPEVDQVGIFFVESLVERQINPLLGWSQGHFIEKIDETGRTGVLTSQGVAVLAVQPDPDAAPFKTGYKSQDKQVVSGRASARGVELAPSNSSDYQAVDVQDFKDIITQTVLRNSGKSSDE